MITPNDIETKVFERSVMGGYKPEDVDEFLDAVTSDFKELFDENTDLVKKISILVKKIEEYQQDDEYLKRAIIAAQKTSEIAQSEANEKTREVMEKAQKEADAIIESAKKEAQIIEEKANNAYEIEKSKIDNEILVQKSVLDETKKEVSDFRTRILNLYKEHFDIINQIPQITKSEMKKEEEDNLDIMNQAMNETQDLIIDTIEENQNEEEAAEKSIFDIEDEIEDLDQAILEESSEFSLIEELEIDDEKEKKKSKFGDLRFGVDYDIND